MSDELPPFDLKDFAIEGWEVDAWRSRYDEDAWELVWSRRAQHVAFTLSDYQWKHRQSASLIASVKAHAEARMRRHFPDKPPEPPPLIYWTFPEG